ncbi:MAG TPA: hypothetical protein VEI02_15810 [Planctomycetota bacterium]|nr:hypothetical protein [Planctomycetota bacterium]
MALKPFVNVKCPCCGEILEVDVEKERVSAHRKGPHLDADRKKGEDDLATALRNRQQAEARAKDQFNAAAEKVKKGESELDRLFREAQKKVKDQGDSFDDASIRKRWD